jgi:hypothetical protein
MGNLTTQGTTSYPAALDTISAVTNTVIAAHPGGLGLALIAVETEMGRLPRGSHASVRARINAASQTVVDLIAASASIPTAKSSGQLVQMVSAALTGVTTSSANVTLSNNPFLSTQGTSFGDSLLVNIKPQASTNRVYARIDYNGTMQSGEESVFAALFLAGSTSAISVYSLWCQDGGVTPNNNAGSFLWQATTVSTATTSYAIRFASQTNNFQLNGRGSGALFNGSLTSSLTVYEVAN